MTYGLLRTFSGEGGIGGHLSGGCTQYLVCIDNLNELERKKLMNSHTLGHLQPG